MGSLSQSTDCLRCFKMIIALIGSLLIAVGYGVEGHPNLRIDPGPGCWNKPCKDASFTINDEIVLEDKKLESDKNKVGECQKLCQANDACKFFSFTHYTNRGDCKLLSEDCAHDTYDDPNHISGPKDCEAIASCPIITTPASLESPETMFWTEITGVVNPYKEQSGLGTKITTSCGDTLHTSECVEDDKDKTKGKWSTGKDGAFDPMNPDDDGSKCKCPELKFWYNPNDEPGAIFSCSKTEVSDDFSLDPTDECVLICDIEVYKHIYCHDGKWNDVEQADMENGIGCFEYPDPNPDGPTTTEDSDITTTEESEDTTTEESEDTTTEESEETTTEESEDTTTEELDTTKKFFDY